jgi:hypothetical protein
MMQVASRVEQAVIEDLRPGEFFAFHMKGETHFGVALGSGLERPQPALVALYPGRPDLMQLPGFLFANQIRTPLLRFPDARIRLPVAREHTHIGFAEQEPPAGALFMIEGRTCLAARFDSANIVYDLASGLPLKRCPPDTVWFSEWEVVEGAERGDRTVCTIACQLRQARRNAA